MNEVNANAPPNESKQTTPSTSTEDLDEILDTARMKNTDYFTTHFGQDWEVDYNGKQVTLNDFILDLIRKTCMEVIGEDERAKIQFSAKKWPLARNKLRATQRETLERLLRGGTIR